MIKCKQCENDLKTDEKLQTTHKGEDTNDLISRGKIAIHFKTVGELIDKGFARELEEGELDRWKAGGGSYYYMAHQMVDDPTNKSTPIRVVFK